MKTLESMKLLKGKSETISMSELRERPGEIINQIQQGKEFTITKAGKIVAVMKCPEEFDMKALQQLRKMA